MPLALFY